MAYGDPVDPTNPGGLGGLLGNAFSNPLFNFGVGLLSTVGQSTDPEKVSGLGNVGKAFSFASSAQQEALKNQAFRQKIAADAREQAGIQKMQEWATANPNATQDQLMGAATQYMPELAIKARLGSYLDPKDRLQMALIEANTARALQEANQQNMGIKGPGGAVARSVASLADVYDAAEEDKNEFAPGGMFNKDSLLGKAGIGPDLALSLPDPVLRLYGDPAEIRRKAGDAALIDKETATLSNNLTQLAQRGTGRSATAIDNYNTAMGAGNIPIPVRRKVAHETLQTILSDLEEAKIDVDPEWYTLEKRLEQQTRSIGKTKAGRDAAAVVPGTDEAAAAASASLDNPPDLGAGPGAAPAQGGLPLPPTLGGTYGAGPGSGIPGMSFVGGAPAAAPAPAVAPAPAAVPVSAPAPAPAPKIPIKGVMTKDFGIDEYTGNPIPIYKYTNRTALERAAKTWKSKGVKRIIVIAPNGQQVYYGE